MAATPNAIIKYDLEKEIMSVLKNNPKASYLSIANYLNSVLEGRGVKETIHRKTVERFIKKNEFKIMELASQKQNQLMVVSMGNQVQIEETILKLLHEGEKYFGDLKVRESDLAGTKQFKNMIETLKLVAQLQGRIKEGIDRSTNIYTVNFGPSVNNYLTELKKTGKLKCAMCGSTDITVKE